MKNVSSFFLFVLVLLLASCSKETTLFTELDVIPGQEAKHRLQMSTVRFNPLAVETISAAMGDEKTIPLQVIHLVKSELTGQIFVDFSGNDDFTDLKIKENQNIEFLSANGSTYTRILQTESYIGSNGVLQIVFSMGSNDLRHLNIGNMQMIIVEEDVAG